MKQLNVLFMGRKVYAAQMLQWTYDQGVNIVAVVTDSHFPHSPTAETARKLHIPVISMEEAETLVQDNSESIDLVLSYLYWNKIHEPLISTPKYGCINFHPAILPDWKGTGGYNVAILNKLPEWGATAHYVDATIDTGAIIKVFRFSFDYRMETAQTLEEKTQKIQCELYKSVMTDILLGPEKKIETIPNVGGRYVSKKELLSMMEIDPEKDDIPLKIHAFWFPPYGGAYVKLNGQEFTLVDNFILRQLQKPNQTANNQSSAIDR